jgi:ribosome-binding protein aMBF1 (putative translation factor)
MSAPMERPRTSSASDVEFVVRSGGEKRFRVPRDKARGFVLLLNEFEVENTSASADEVFKELDEKFGRAGSALQGARLKEGLSQVDLAEKLKISQGDLSKMEHGKRSIGKAMAKRLSRVLKVDYRIFL